MLKRTVAICVCLALLLSAAVAETNQLSKLKGQWRSSAFRGTVTSELSGDMSGLTGDTLWQTLKALADGYQLEITHTVMSASNDDGDETVLILTDKAGEEAGRINILTDASGVVYLQSELLNDSGLYYAFDSGFDWSTLLLPGENGWPSLLHVLLEVSRASKSWQDRAKPYMEQMSLNISRWLQNHATTSTEVEVDGTYVTTMSYEIPATDVLQETRQVLADFFHNRELLAVMADIMTADEQAAYLQSGSVLTFLQMLDNVKLTGTILARRQFETTSGRLLYDSITIPCPESLPVRSFILTHVPTAAEGELWQMSLTLDAERLNVAVDQDLRLDVTAQNTDEDVWTGSVLAILPGSTDPEALNQEDQTLFSCAYNLNAPAPKDTNDYYQSRYERRYEATLVVKPDVGMGLPSFSVGGQFVAYSKSSSAGSISYVDADLTLTDLDEEGGVSLKLEGRTTQRWVPTMLADALSAALRLDMMNAQSRLELLSEMLGHLTQTLSAKLKLP